MESIIISKPKRVNQWMNDYISPGPVGVVGDVLVNEKLKKSCPELLPRYSFSTNTLGRRGAGVQDGTWYNAHNDALTAEVYRQTFYDKNYNEIQIGSAVQDLRLQDLKAESRLLGTPQFGWKSMQASVLNARVTGEQFLPAPGGYMPSGGISRGPQPRINMLVDNTTPLGPITPFKPEAPLVSNVPAQDGRDNLYPGVENVQPITAQNFEPIRRTGLMRF